MTGQTAEILGAYGNVNIVQIPGRRFPGVCIQGDTTWTWLQLVEGVLREHPDSEDAKDLREAIEATLSAYEATQRDRGQPLPYFRQT